MAQLTGAKLFGALRGLFSALDSTDDDFIKSTMFRKKVSLVINDAATAGTAHTETFMWRNDTGIDMRVVSAYAVAPIAVTANGTSYATFLVASRTAAGASAANVATFATDTTTTDDMVALAPKAMTLTAANVIVPAGYVLTGAVTKTSSGVALTAATSQALIEVLLEPAS